jgi:hypothetical protein
MNEYTVQTIARQRMEETARNARYAYRTTRPERRFQLPRLTWSIRHHAPVTPAHQG